MTIDDHSGLVNAPSFPIEWMYGLPGDSQTVPEVEVARGSSAG